MVLSKPILRVLAVAAVLFATAGLGAAGCYHHHGHDDDIAFEVHNRTAVTIEIESADGVFFGLVAPEDTDLFIVDERWSGRLFEARRAFDGSLIESERVFDGMHWDVE